MKASIGLAAHAGSRTEGGRGVTSGRKAQWARSFSVIWYSPFRAAVGGAAASVAPGHGAPISTQRVKTAILDPSSFFDGGILRNSSAWLMAVISRLSSRLPGTTAGPESPPARAEARESSRRLALGLSAP